MVYNKRLEKAQEELENYINSNAKELANQCLEAGGVLNISTCGVEVFAGSVKLHSCMPRIARRMKNLGIDYYYTEKAGIDYWRFMVKI